LSSASASEQVLTAACGAAQSSYKSASTSEHACVAVRGAGCEACGLAAARVLGARGEACANEATRVKQATRVRLAVIFFIIAYDNDLPRRFPKSSACQ